MNELLCKVKTFAKDDRTFLRGTGRKRSSLRVVQSVNVSVGYVSFSFAREFAKTPPVFFL